MSDERTGSIGIYALLAILFINVLIMISVIKGVNYSATVERTTIYPLPLFPDLTAEVYLVKIAGQEGSLAKRREWKKFAPASLTKLLTALVAKEELTDYELVSFTEDAKKTEEKISKIAVGEKFLRDEVIKTALIGSFNDAALALAKATAEKMGITESRASLKIFRDLMGERARSLDMKSSHFRNPTGLDETDHYSTAEDLTRLAEYIWFNNSDLWKISREVETLVVSEAGNEYKIGNTNELLKEYPGILGGKTGFTDNAKGALLFLYPVRGQTPKASADTFAHRTSNGVYPVRPEKTIIVVLLGSKDRFADGREIINWLESFNF